MKNSPRHAISSKDSCIYAPEDVFQAGIANHHIANTAYPIHHGQTIHEYRLSDYQDMVNTLKKTRSSYDTL